jgi:hypothetical protein
MAARCRAVHKDYPLAPADYVLGGLVEGDRQRRAREADQQHGRLDGRRFAERCPMHRLSWRASAVATPRRSQGLERSGWRQSFLCLLLRQPVWMRAGKVEAALGRNRVPAGLIAPFLVFRGMGSLSAIALHYDGRSRAVTKPAWMIPIRTITDGAARPSQVKLRSWSTVRETDDAEHQRRPCRPADPGSDRPCSDCTRVRRPADGLGMAWGHTARHRPCRLLPDIPAVRDQHMPGGALKWRRH